MDLTKKICRLAKTMNMSFTFRDKIMTHEEVFAETGLLPAITKRADQLASLCLGYGLGVVFSDNDKAVLGTKVQFDDTTPNILRLACICDVLLELKKHSPNKEVITLDELAYD